METLYIVIVVVGLFLLVTVCWKHRETVAAVIATLDSNIKTFCENTWFAWLLLMCLMGAILTAKLAFSMTTLTAPWAVSFFVISMVLLGAFLVGGEVSKQWFKENLRPVSDKMKYVICFGVSCMMICILLGTFCAIPSLSSPCTSLPTATPEPPPKYWAQLVYGYRHEDDMYSLVWGFIIWI